jgi:predicted transcriptional regulator
MRGRPPLTRARVLTYWRKHGPCSIMQVCRVTGADRRHVQRIMRAAEKAGMVMG